MTRLTVPRVFIDRVEGTTVVTLNDARILTEDLILDLEDQLSEVGTPGPSRVVINFAEVRFMSTMMLAVLLKFARRITRGGGELRLCCITADLHEAFKVTKFDQIFRICSDEPAALDSF